MDPQLIALIVAFVGSSGIVGALTLAVQHSRAVRLRRSIREGLELATSLEIESRPSAALRAAATLDAYRLAAMSLVQWGGFVISYLLTVLAMLILAGGLAWYVLSNSGMSTEGLDTLSNPLLWAAVLIGYIVIFVAMFDALLRIRRDRLVIRLTEPGAVRIVVGRTLSRVEDA